MATIPIHGLEMVGELDLPSSGHMALDEVLLDAVADGRRPPLLRFWGWIQPTLVLGSNQAVSNELDLPAVERRGFTIESEPIVQVPGMLAVSIAIAAMCRFFSRKLTASGE